MLDADKLLNCLPFSTLVEELAAMHREPIGLVDEMLMESVDDNGSVNHFFIRSGWQPEKAVGAKLISIFPRNNETAKYPSIQAVYVLFEGEHGSPLACLDGTALTWLKTAADSALASSLLSRDDVASMLMIGAGQMAPYLVEAHCALRPSIERVSVWNRSADKAAQLCGDLARRLPKIEFTVSGDLQRSVREAGLVCSAIGCVEPLLEGAWLQPGTHVDLVGAYTPEMREADDAVLTRGSLFVDARETTIHHIGELMIPLAAGVITESDVRADLAQLCLQQHPGRRSRDEITVFKNGGGGHLDLMCARILHHHCLNA
jgi:alanine dehydrogenase